ncbi:hypothetical protein H4218_003617 [Coemansia sp. IMI 209128]|nr:hypothetical protein H4218_003617 [Coemansia sp. IMI 209128]
MKVFSAVLSALLLCSWQCGVSGNPAAGQSPCNGHKELCSRPYNKVSFACTHNSYSYAPPAGSPVLNQERTIKEQLNDGIRAFMLDVVRPSPEETLLTRIGSFFRNLFTHEEKATDSRVHLCHGSCDLIDKGPLADTLVVFREFLDANPNEVITFIIENVSGFTVKDLQPSFASSGIEKYAFTPNPSFSAHSANHAGYQWPTLGQLIGDKHRLVVFIDDKAQPDVVPYILPEWDYVVELPYSNIHPIKEFPCNQDRPHDGQPRDLLVLNHFGYNRLTIAGKNIDTPLTSSQVKENGYNSLDSLQTHLNTCAKTWGDSRVFNFVTLDYYDVGDRSIFHMVDKINGVGK